MTLLVTGSAGFIGSHFVKRLLQSAQTDRIITLDLLTYAGNFKNLEGISTMGDHVFIHGDIRDAALVNKIFEDYRIDKVINFAAESHVDRSIKAPDTFVSTNILGTQILLETASRHWMAPYTYEGVPQYRQGTRFVQISTDEVYGTLKNEHPFTEEDPLLPNNPYAASKAAADLLVRAYWKTYKFPMNITRCCNNYGPNQHREKLIPLMIERARKRIPLPVYGDGLQVREWLFVEDHCSALERVLQNGMVGEIYNIGSGMGCPNIDVIHRILEAVGGSEELIQHVADRLGHDVKYALNSDKIQRELGWIAETSFEEGLKKTIDWYCRQ